VEETVASAKAADRFAVAIYHAGHPESADADHYDSVRGRTYAAAAALYTLTGDPSEAAGSAAYAAAGPPYAVATGLSYDWEADAVRESGMQCCLLREFFGPFLFRSLPVLVPSILVWNGGAIIGLARSAYDLRQLPSGHLDADRLAVLADALE